MILIADSGSTKTIWQLITENNEPISCKTGGINPFFLGKEEILRLLKTEFTIDSSAISEIFFYGAGCTPEKSPILFDALHEFFGIENINIASDLLGAARSLCQHNAGIACILGTGSNSCFYDGKEIVKNVSPLGFILGDEGSGAVLGKKLIADILKNQFSEELKERFLSTYAITAQEILEKVYKKPFPNRYLAQYTRFIAQQIHFPEMENLVLQSFREFFERNILQYKESKNYPLHFTGSIASVFEKQLRETAETFGFKIGTITKNPMEGLVKYHNKM